MVIPREILILLCSIGAIQSFFLSYTLFKTITKTSYVSIIVSVLFFFIGLRVTKSVLWAFWTNTPIWFINIGFAAHLTVGPLILLYIYYSLYNKKKFPILNYLHFLPSLIVLLLSFNLTLNDFWYQFGYSSLLYHQLIYTTVAGIILYRSFTHIQNIEAIRVKIAWLLKLWIGIAILNLAYFTNYILGWTSYFLGPVLYSGIVYILSFFVYKNKKIFEGGEKYKNISLSDEENKNYLNKIISLVENESLYLNPSFTLTMLSQKSSIPQHIISQVLNVKMGINFSEFINRYRIEKAKSLLVDPNFINIKIANIAYDCGFNSLSAFNAAFKKNTKQTPSEFKSHFKSN